MRKSYGMAFCLPSCFTTVSTCDFKGENFVCYSTEEITHFFFFSIILFAEFTSELRLFLKEVTLISFFSVLFSEFTKRCGSESIDNRV